MNIQIYGKPKCFDTQKAERWFKERGVKFQSINLLEKAMSKGEFQNVARAVGGLDPMIDAKAKDQATVTLLNYLGAVAREEKVFENQQVLKTPIVRNGKQATLGFQPDIWQTWA